MKTFDTVERHAADSGYAGIPYLCCISLLVRSDQSEHFVFNRKVNFWHSNDALEYHRNSSFHLGVEIVAF